MMEQTREGGWGGEKEGQGRCRLGLRQAGGLPCGYVLGQKGRRGVGGIRLCHIPLSCGSKLTRVLRSLVHLGTFWHARTLLPCALPSPSPLRGASSREVICFIVSGALLLFGSFKILPPPTPTDLCPGLLLLLLLLLLLATPVHVLAPTRRVHVTPLEASPDVVTGVHGRQPLQHRVQWRGKEKEEGRGEQECVLCVFVVLLLLYGGGGGGGGGKGGWLCRGQGKSACASCVAPCGYKEAKARECKESRARMPLWGDWVRACCCTCVSRESKTRRKQKRA